MNKSGDGRRIARMEREVQHSVANYLISGFRSETGALITVTHVKMPADLRSAKVYVSVLFPEGSKVHIEDVLHELQTAAPNFQSHLAHQMKTRYCPKLTFFKDDSTEHVMKVERILHDLQAEREMRQREPSTDQGSNDDVE